MTETRFGAGLWVIMCLGGFLCLASSFPCLAEENQPLAAQEAPLMPGGEPLPYHETQGSLFLGYRWVDLDQLTLAGEYQDPHSSLSAEVEAISCPLPHRFHFNSEFFGADNYYGDVGYAYSDLLLFRDIFTGLYHNLEHIDYSYAGEPGIAYDERSAGAVYFTTGYDNLLSLRLKAPDFPLHGFLSHRYVAKEGSIQERFMLGFFNKTTQARQIDWNTSALTLGTNSHLGPLEIEYAYESSEFDPGPNPVLYDFYPAMAGRPADIYPHSVVAETESHANSIKLHTSYTGGIVASASLDNLSEKNNYSNASADTWHGVFDLSWIPDPMLNFFFKYRHQDLTTEQPASVILYGQGGNQSAYAVRPSLSSTRDLLSLAARYKPIRKTTLHASYEFEHRKRQDLDGWQTLTESTDTNSLALTADTRIFNKLQLKAHFHQQLANNPSLNTEPDASSEIGLSASYQPFSWMTAFFDLDRIVSDRDDIRFWNDALQVIVGGGHRETSSDRLLGSLSFFVSSKTNLTASWAYYRNKVDQTLAYGQWDPAVPTIDSPFLDLGVPYRDEANHWSLAITVLPREDITCTVNLSHTVSEGEFMPGIVVAENPASIASFSPLKVTETALSLEVAKRFRKYWEARVQLYANGYNDRIDDALDGTFYSSTFGIKRHF